MAGVKRLVPKKDNSLSEKLICRGDLVNEDQKKQTIKWCSLHLRLPEVFLEKIDEVLKNRFSISRTAWILEAIQEKLKKENG
jgi:hypothetical protein